ncbi:formylmethanofuran dehydrogenase subunit C [Piscinibacter defluvii]|uniref:formylmethanofuran dehydrogenase subunit C n=1 Tax=Piscinibacter defluvii TaxID=1796922 RepID=UPI000FDDA3B3|nr:formylmethanofuran dehydrogenase subunit C [Piscinibacter defluvii]
MSGWTLTLKRPLALRLDLRGVLPGLDDPAATLVGYGNTLVPLAEFFTASRRDDDALVLEGDLAKADRIGWQMAGGTLIVDGNAGDCAGGAMRGGTLRIGGSARDLAGCEMSGGLVEIGGNVGDFAAGTLPGSMDGMRGGTLIVRGRAGARFGDRMRRGTALLFGDAGDFLGSRMVAGTIALAGRCGAHAGYGMRRGSLVFAGAAPADSPTFVPAVADAPVFWQLLARDLARHGGAFAELPRRAIRRRLGDLAAGGKGELITLA